MATLAVRALDANGDPLKGSGKANLLYDADALAQIIITRIKLFLGEWWLDMSDGTPLFQSILNNGRVSSLTAIEHALQLRILGTPFVTGLSNVAVAFDPTSRALYYSAAVQSSFGVIILTNNPASQATLNS